MSTAIIYLGISVFPAFLAAIVFVDSRRVDDKTLPIRLFRATVLFVCLTITVDVVVRLMEYTSFPGSDLLVWGGSMLLCLCIGASSLFWLLNVLERFQIAVIGEDPIARSVASRMWNIATATTDNSGMMLCDSEVPTDVDLVLEIASDELPADAAPRATIALAECHNLAQRIRTANVAAQQKPARIRIELTGMTRYNGTFTASDAQTLAVRLLDGVCDALAD